MTKSILQLENTNATDFKNEIIAGVNVAFQNFAVQIQSNDDDKLLTREETAELLSVSLVTLWDWTKKDIITAYRIGNRVRYKKGEVIQALQKQNNFRQQ